MGIIENVKEITEFIKKNGDLNLYRKVVELEAEVLEMVVVCREQGAQLRALRMRAEIVAGLHFGAPFYVSADGSEFYCARCVDADGMAMHVVATADKRDGYRVWCCPQCKTEYTETRLGGARAGSFHEASR